MEHHIYIYIHIRIYVYVYAYVRKKEGNWKNRIVGKRTRRIMMIRACRQKLNLHNLNFTYTMIRSTSSQSLVGEGGRKENDECVAVRISIGNIVVLCVCMSAVCVRVCRRQAKWSGIAKNHALV